MNSVDGIPGDAVPLDDRGFNYGDGLFETIALRRGEPRHWLRHLARLSEGAARLGFESPASEQLLADLRAALPSPAPDRLVAKLIVTRGSGGRGYAPPEPCQPRRIVRLSPWPEWPTAYATDGIDLVRCATPLGRNPALAGLKHLNRLEQVLAGRELAARGAVEGLMSDDRGRVIEGTRTNVFAVIRGELQTPMLDECGIAGVMRGVVADLARELGVPVRETRLTHSALEAADELFVCNSLIGLWPVRSIAEEGGRIFGARPLTRVLLEALRDRDLLP